MNKDFCQHGNASYSPKCPECKFKEVNSRLEELESETDLLKKTLANVATDARMAIIRMQEQGCSTPASEFVLSSIELAIGQVLNRESK